MTRIPHIVLDTNVLVAAARSQHGASAQVVSMIGAGAFEMHISVPLVLEYEDVLKRMIPLLQWTDDDIDAVVDYICTAAHHHRIWFLWRPLLNDVKDDFVLELAITAQADAIITFNLRDFAEARRLGVKTLTPGEFLHLLGERA